MAGNRTRTVGSPVGLKAATRRWYLDVVNDWLLEEHHRRVLEVAARAWDQAMEADRLLREDGLVVKMPSGAQRPHPMIRVANEARGLFLRSLRELDLDIDAPAEAKRPPALRSIASGRH